MYSDLSVSHGRTSLGSKLQRGHPAGRPAPETQGANPCTRFQQGERDALFQFHSSQSSYSYSLTCRSSTRSGTDRSYRFPPFSPMLTSPVASVRVPQTFDGDSAHPTPRVATRRRGVVRRRAARRVWMRDHPQRADHHMLRVYPRTASAVMSGRCFNPRPTYAIGSIFCVEAQVTMTDKLIDILERT